MCSANVILAEIAWIAHFFQAFWIISLCLMLIEQLNRSVIRAKTKYYQSKPRYCRRVASLPQSNYYKPRGIPLTALRHTTLTFDELEAIRLTDLQGLYQADAAVKMNISRQTLGRILESAHKKIADALVNGRALEINGGTVEFAEGGSPHRFRHGRGGHGRGRGGPK
jgi:predicted DNA-binding protein (UPF0251 family)